MESRRLLRVGRVVGAGLSMAGRIRTLTATRYKAQQVAETYWLYVVWVPLGHSPELVRIHNTVAKLDHAKRKIVVARFHEIPADAMGRVARRQGA